VHPRNRHCLPPGQIPLKCEHKPPVLFLQIRKPARKHWKREFATGNEIPRIVAHRWIIEASIGKLIVQTIEAPRSPGHRSNHRAAQEATLSHTPDKQFHSRSLRPSFSRIFLQWVDKQSPFVVRFLVSHRIASQRASSSAEEALWLYKFPMQEAVWAPLALCHKNATTATR
jgi:hypothetical protein